MELSMWLRALCSLWKAFRMCAQGILQPRQLVVPLIPAASLQRRENKKFCKHGGSSTKDSFPVHCVCPAVYKAFPLVVLIFLSSGSMRNLRT